jgi:hypothetical protein
VFLSTVVEGEDQLLILLGGRLHLPEPPILGDIGILRRLVHDLHTLSLLVEVIIALHALQCLHALLGVLALVHLQGLLLKALRYHLWGDEVGGLQYPTSSTLWNLTLPT